MKVAVHILWCAQELGCVIILVVVMTDGLGCNIVGCVLILAMHAWLAAAFVINLNLL